MFTQTEMLASYAKKPQPNKLAPLAQELFETKLDFSDITAEVIRGYMFRIKKCYQETYDAVASLKKTPEKISFATAVQPLLDVEIYTQKARALCTFPQHVHQKEEVRDESEKAEEEFKDFLIECEQRYDVFEVLRYYETEIYQKEQEKLDEEEQLAFTDIMEEYKRNGLYIEDPEKRNALKKIKQEIEALATEFQANLNKDDTSFEKTAEELKGLPEDWLADPARKLPNGKYKVTLKYPDFFPIMEYAQHRQLRKDMYIAFETRCEEKNIPILKRIVELRHMAAQMLDYKTHAEYIAETRILETEDKVSDFLNTMNQRFTPLLEKNLHELTQFARNYEKNDSFTLQIYDMRRYLRLREEAMFNIDMNEIKKYFPLEKVVSGTLQIYQDLLGLRFIKKNNKASWHPDTLCYDVFDQASQIRIGNFTLDLHPRTGKFGHAAAFPHALSCDISHITNLPRQRQENIAALVVNFPKDNFSFDDVVTFFHEFGHIMHFMCSKAKLTCYHADKTETDFVEAPSQMLENWCYEPAVLRMISAHPDTQQPLPADIALKLKEKDKLHAGYFYKRQLLYGIFDAKLYTLPIETLRSMDIKEFFQQLQQSILHLPVVPEACVPANFCHSVDGYDFGYYGYLLSESYAADMYDTVFSANPLSKEAGSHYRRCILEPGSTKEGMELLKDFLGGREPKLDAFLQQCGLSENKNQIIHDIDHNDPHDQRELKHCL